jgi:hypothetical protein
MVSRWESPTDLLAKVISTGSEKYELRGLYWPTRGCFIYEWTLFWGYTTAVIRRKSKWDKAVTQGDASFSKIPRRKSKWDKAVTQGDAGDVVLEDF